MKLFSYVCFPMYSNTWPSYSSQSFGHQSFVCASFFKVFPHQTFVLYGIINFDEDMIHSFRNYRWNQLHYWWCSKYIVAILFASHNSFFNIYSVSLHEMLVAVLFTWSKLLVMPARLVFQGSKMCKAALHMSKSRSWVNWSIAFSKTKLKVLATILAM